MSIPKMTVSEKHASLAERLEAGSALIPWCGCRIWMGATNEHGYGVIGFGRSSRLKTHRAAYMLAHGQIPKGAGYHGTVVRHTCDMPACINPDHLIAGTQQDNLKDTKSRNRLKFGSRHHAAKLSEEDVSQILALKGRETQGEIAKRYGVYPSVISRIFGGHAWARAVKGDIS